MSLQRMQYSRHDLTVSNSLRPSGCPKEILKFCYMISWTRDENTAIYAVFWHIVIITSSRYMWWIVIYVWKKLRSKMNNKISIFFFSENGDIAYCLVNPAPIPQILQFIWAGWYSSQDILDRLLFTYERS